MTRWMAIYSSSVVQWTEFQVTRVYTDENTLFLERRELTVTHSFIG